MRGIKRSVNARLWWLQSYRKCLRHAHGMLRYCSRAALGFLFGFSLPLPLGWACLPIPPSRLVVKFQTWDEYKFIEQMKEALEELID